MRFKREVKTFVMGLLLTLPLSFFCIQAKSQSKNESFVNGGRTAALGGAYATLDDFWSMMVNPANLSGLNHPLEAGAAHKNHYLTKEISSTSVALATKLQHFNSSISISRYGISSYNQGIAAIGVGKQLSKKVSLGVKLCYSYIQASEKNVSVGAFSGEVGLKAFINKRLTVAAHIANPTHQSIGIEQQEELPSCLTIGSCYKTPYGFTLFVDTFKPANNPLSVSCGVEWSPYKSFTARSGFCSAQGSLTFGIGYSANRFNLDIATSRHPALGYSPLVSTSFWFNRNKR